MSMFVITDSVTHERQAPAPPSVPVAPSMAWYASVKVAVDFVLALVILILSLPIMLIAMLLIKLTSPGPVIYAQTRLGKKGEPFTIYKLRTMTFNCESLTGAQWSKPGDTRVTGVGRWLRKTHIDELPQLWNVLRGDMSLIGPRPERPEFIPALEQVIPLYRERLLVRPGVTGFAQVQLPPDADFDGVRIKLAYDLHYVKNVSLMFDMAIYFGTFLKILGMSFSMISVLCVFPKREHVQRDYDGMIPGTGQPSPLAAESVSAT